MTEAAEREKREVPSASTASAVLAAVDPASLLIDRPAAGQVRVIDVVHAKTLKFAFDLKEASISILDVDAVLSFADGGRIILPTLVLKMVSAEPPIMRFTGGDLDPQTMIASAGDMRFFEQLPQLAASETARLQNKGDAQQAPQGQSVQLPATQQFANTPAPAWRQQSVTQGLGESDIVESVSRFGKRSVSDSSSELRSEGALVERSDRAGVAPEPENAAPTITSGGGGEYSLVSHHENTTAVTQVSAVDPDSPQIFFAIVGGADSERFVINGLTGQLFFLQGPNFEQSAAQYQPNIYEVFIAASDGQGRDIQAVYVTVTDVNEAPTGVSFSTATVFENVANGTLVGRAIGIDPDVGATLTYSFAPGGDAGGRFSIDAATGEVRVLRGDLIDYEASSSQLIVVRVTDQDGLSVDRPIVLTVLDANDAPVIISNGGGDSAVVSIPENAVGVTIVSATDTDAGASLTYSIAGGADAARFMINPLTGTLTLVQALDFEAPTDADGNNVYDVVVQVTDDRGGTDTQTLAVRVTNQNEAPVILSNTGYIIPENAPNGTPVTLVHAIDPDAGDTIRFSLAPGGDANGAFEIDAVTGQVYLRDNSLIDFQTNPTMTVVVRITDSAGLFDDQAFTIRITDVNQPPEIISNGGGDAAMIVVGEGQSVATTVIAVDPDSGATVTYSIIGGDDAARFTINPTTGVLSFVAAPDFETPADANGDNIYDIIVRTTDGVLSDEQTIHVIVQDGNDVPVIVSNGGGTIASLSIAENTVSIATVTATDADTSDTLSYSIVGGPDAVRFVIDAVTGVLTLAQPANFELPLDSDANNIYQVTVAVDDGHGGLDLQQLSITVTNVNEAPVITSFGGGASATLTGLEGATAIATASAIDPDGVASLTFTIVGGADAARVNIHPVTGVLTFVAAPDFESPADANGDNIYEVVIQVSDGLLTDTQALSIALSNANDPPVITSDGGGATALISLAENITAVTTVAAVDADASATITYSISGGADGARFSIDSSTGALSFVSAPDFEIVGDANLDNIYEVQVSAADQFGAVDTQVIRVAISNTNEAPTITSNGGGATASLSVLENTTAVTTVTSTDPDIGAVRVYSIVGGADQALFTINAATGALVFNAAPNFETPTDAGGNNVYDVVVQVSDVLGGVDTQALAITVNNQNEAPVITSLGGGAVGTVTLVEGVQNATIVAATDPDSGPAPVFSIIGGPDAARFTINASTGQLQFVGIPDFETPLDADLDNVYTVIVQASDGTLNDTQTVNITISNQNEAPVITSLGGGPSAGVTIAEGGTLATTVTATDGDAGATLTYSIVGGADQALFTINASTGALAFISNRDYETPGDIGGDNIYDVVIQVSDGVGGIDTQALAVTVSNVNEVPVITSDGGGPTAALSLIENSTAVTTVVATDPDLASTLTYSISGGADAVAFIINASTGALSFVTAPNFELPTDANGDNIYEVIVTASDGSLSDTQTITVTVTNQNEAPVITSNGAGPTASISVGEGLLAVTTVTATDPDTAATRTFSIIGGADQALFTLNATTGALAFIAGRDFETPGDVGTNNIYDVIVQVSDGLGGVDTQAIAVTITNVNEAPVITSNGAGPAASISIAENTTAVTTVTSTDPDAGATRTFSIVGGADQTRFTINATTGALAFTSGRNFEGPSDVGFNNVYDVIVRVTDQFGATDDQAIAVTITNVNEAPTITSSATVNLNENQTNVITVTSTDPDAGAARVFSIVGGTDSAAFTINGTTGALTLNSAPNFEAPVDVGNNNTYQVQVRVSDGLGGIANQTITVNILNVNEAPTITSNGGGATASISVAENTTAVTTVTATDPDASTTFTYSIIGGADAARFTINASTGALSFVSAPNFESPVDSGPNNVYDVQVRVSDGALTATQTLAVTVINAPEAPVITSNGGGGTAAINVAENNTAVTTVTATDQDVATTLTYSLAGGADQALFTINATTGALAFITAPNFETPTDSGPNNVYDVIVQVSDGTLIDTQTIAITVTNAPEAPVITSNGGGPTAAINVAENSTAVTTVTATDQDAATTLTYSIVGGADQTRFVINASTGVLSFVSAPNFEAPADVGANDVYDVRVRVSDGTLFTDQDIAVTVTDQPEAPFITSNGGGATAAITLGENTAAVTTVTATDVDVPSTLTYSIVGGADQALFTINATTGALAFITAPNFEAPADFGANNVYDVQVQVSDGALVDVQDIAITVTNQNEAPVITSDGGGATAAISVVENGTAVTTVAATDVDVPSTLTYSIVGGADQALFTINATTGALAFITAPNFETPADFGANNVYDVQVQVSDGSSTDVQDIAVTVTNQNEAPVITSNGGGATAAITVVENGTVVTTVAATDVDVPSTLTYSIVGGADQALFTINATTGALAFITAPNFETPTDFGANNVYDVQVQVSDGALTDVQDIAVTVTNQNEAPVITSNGGGATAAVSRAENGTTVTTVTATDVDASTTLAYSIVGGADQARFTINASTGALSFVSAPDFEVPTDLGLNNVYDVRVRVSDGTLFADQDIAVTITNLNDNAPVITSNGGGPIAADVANENSVGIFTVVTATDADIGSTITYSIVGGADQALFTINSTTGQIRFTTGRNFEVPTDADLNGIYEVIVQASDGTLTDTQTINVTVNNVNEAPVITSDGGAATAAVSVAENTTAVTTVTATDQDAGATQFYSIVGGADQALFTINATTGALAFITAPNFETPTDAGFDNVYNVQVRVSDGTLTDVQDIAVTVTNQNEAPTITSDGGGATAAVSISENGTAVTTVAATDVDVPSTLTYSIAGGADQALFTINATTGALAFITAPDFEVPTDAGANNVYDVQVQVSDGTLTDVQDIAITVTNVSGPTINGTIAHETHIGTAEDEIINGNGGNDFYVTGLGADTVNGTVGGYDTVDYRTSNAGVTVSLVSGPGIGGHAQGDTYTSVEGVFGSNYDDVITGNAANNWFISGLGADQINGGAGDDWISYDHSAVGVTVDFNVATQIGGEADGDILTNIESMSGSQYDDILRGSSANNTIRGLNGDDIIEGRGGNDILEGSDGNDTISGGDDNDTLYGQNGNDTLNGDAGDDALYGDVGNDTLNGGAGNDTLNGGGGNDHLFGGGDNDVLILETTSLFLGATADGGTGADTVRFTGTGTLSSGDIALALTNTETIDFTGAGVDAALANFTAANATSILGASGPGNTLTLDFDAGDTFSVAAGQDFTQSGNLYTFYTDNTLTTELARVNIV